jgi:hypothetical protein
VSLTCAFCQLPSFVRCGFLFEEPEPGGPHVYRSYDNKDIDAEGVECFWMRICLFSLALSGTGVIT